MTVERLIGIDFGEKRIGIALTDPLMTFAYAHQTIANDKNVWEELKKIIQSKNVTKVVLGLPDKEKNPELAAKVRKFRFQLKERFGLEVITWDESFTSAMAQARVMEAVTKKKKRRDKGLIDRNSAAIILQEYLDSR